MVPKLPSLLLVRPFNEAKREQRSRHYLDAGWALLCMAFVVSATVEGRGLGYATIVLFAPAIMTLALTRPGGWAAIVLSSAR